MISYTIEAWSGTKMKFIGGGYCTKVDAIKQAVKWSRRLHYVVKVFHDTKLVWQRG
jgi:hypothetical protein